MRSSPNGARANGWLAITIVAGLLAGDAAAQTAWMPVTELNGVAFEFRSIQRCEGNYTQWRATNTSSQTVTAYLRERIYHCGEGQDHRAAFAAFYDLEPGQVREGLREDFVCPDVVVNAELLAEIEPHETESNAPGPASNHQRSSE
ncbi:MAG: hypothetical protein ACK4IT_03040 [Thioalkalivibrionaceae bacterium]